MFVAYNLHKRACSDYTTTRKYLLLQQDMSILRLCLLTAVIYHLIAFTFGKHDFLRYV